MVEKIKSTTLFTCVTLLSSFLPLIGSAVWILFQRGNIPSVLQIAGKGEITIICIPILVSAFYSLYYYKDEYGTRGLYSIFHWMTFAFIVIGLIVYSAASPGIHSDSKLYLLYFSYTILVWTISALFYSKYAEPEQLPIKDLRRNDLADLEKRVAENKGSHQ